MEHLKKNTGRYEWYTPGWIIERARAGMGGAIDLDPASSAIANETVQAAKFYTEEDDGLAWDWHGRVFLNPPYGRKIIDEFIFRLLCSYEMGFCTEWVTLTNNVTETKWAQDLLFNAASVCFLKRRVKFENAHGKKSGPLQGQMVCYQGPAPDRFIGAFRDVGVCFDRSLG